MSNYWPHRRGQRGESLAAEYLEQRGFSVIAQNYRHRRSEIDLIVRRDDTLVFAEVKLRKDAGFGYPESFVNPSQANRIVAAADYYLHETNWEGAIRFDIIAITLRPQLKIEHFEDAFC